MLTSADVSVKKNIVNRNETEIRPAAKRVSELADTVKVT